MKITKEFSDALGFKLLSSFTGFMAEYPVEGAQIQKICDDGFKETCFKCYPIITDLGVDPLSYTPKQTNEQVSLRNELRKQFPIKQVEPKPEPKPKSKEPDVVEISKPASPKPVSPMSNSSVELFVPSQPVKPVPVNYVTKCQKCMFIKQAEDINLKTIQDLNRQLANEQTKSKTLHRELNNAHSEIKILRAELANYKNDPEFLTIIQYQKMKRQRKQ